MKQQNNNTFGKNSWSHHWEKLCFLRNTLGKISRVATDQLGQSFWPIILQNRLVISVNLSIILVSIFYGTLKWHCNLCIILCFFFFLFLFLFLFLLQFFDFVVGKFKFLVVDRVCPGKFSIESRTQWGQTMKFKS